MKPCRVVLNDIKELLDDDGFYIVPGRSRRALTCYRCFKKFYSAEALEVHKAEHEPESGEEDVYAVSDSEIEIEVESDSDDEGKTETDTESLLKRSSKSPSRKKTESLAEKKAKVQASDNPIEYVPKPPESPQTKQVQVVEPIMAKPKKIVANVSTTQPSNKSTPQTSDAKKVPVLCNIQIKCLGCDVLFTNSELLMQHTAVDPDKPCSFTCKVCTESYSQPSDYLEHIMQHNTFSSSRYGNRGGPRRSKPEFRCTYCPKEFEYGFLMKQHEEKEHQKQLQALRKPVVVIEPPRKTVVSPKPIEIVQKPRYILPKSKEIPPKPAETKTEPKPKTEQNIPSKSKEESTNSTNESADAKKPKIWVIKEASLKSPEPPVPNEPKSAIVGSTTLAAKRKLDDVEKMKELLKPAKRGRPARTGPVVVLNPGYSPNAKQVTSLTCDECFDVFQTKAAFDEHMVFHEANKDGVVSTSNSGDSTNFPCNLCNMHFKSVAGLRRHQSCIHEKETSFVCVKCSKIFSSNKGLNIHRSFCSAASS